MEEKNTNVSGSQTEIISWEIPEYVKQERGRGWYYKAIAIAVILTIFSSLSVSLSPFKVQFVPNFLFYIIIILVFIIYIITQNQEPPLIKIAITHDGVQVGRKFYDYDVFKNFAIVYKPKENLKNLYFEFKSSLKQRLSIPLDNANPLIIRDNLLQYLEEDLERTDMSLSEGLAKKFKL